MSRKSELQKMTVLGGLNDLAREYDINIDHMRKGEIIEAILEHENKNQPKKKRPPRNEAKTKIKALRVASGLTQAELAYMIDINLGTLKHYEQGSKPFDSANIGVILKACNVFKCKLEDILESPEILSALKQYNAN